MNGMTLKMLRKALKVLRTAKRFQKANIRKELIELEQAEEFLVGKRAVKPRDPREVLAGVGYKL